LERATRPSVDAERRKRSGSGEDEEEGRNDEVEGRRER